MKAKAHMAGSVYLGGVVYARFDGHQILLETPFEDSNIRIALDKRSLKRLSLLECSIDLLFEGSWNKMDEIKSCLPDDTIKKSLKDIEAWADENIGRGCCCALEGMGGCLSCRVNGKELYEILDSIKSKGGQPDTDSNPEGISEP